MYKAEVLVSRASLYSRLKKCKPQRASGNGRSSQRT